MVDQVTADFRRAPISEKLRALLVIAGKVQQGGRRVTEEDVAQARKEGADDKAIHDTVLIAAAFCMFNRYVDGLATWTPDDPAVYERTGEKLARGGYLTSNGKQTAKPVHPNHQLMTLLSSVVWSRRISM